ncbi:MAG: hypothetical protein QMC66_10195 [Ascidiaceihabitans sp.]|jgi:hypothetical protein|tara:strand:- start:954 stop:1130 length:177 start_codon:yes stop_codon:yes gene_type:complete
MIRFIALIAFTALASCGVDGAPIKPTVNAGINVGSGGVKTGVNLGASKGLLSVNWNLF